MHSPRTVSDLLASAERYKYLFFWGHTPDKSGQVTKSCFSQWWHAPFEVDGRQYPTAEHFMMAQKARLFDDSGAFEKIVSSRHPREAKQVGRTIRNFKEDVWMEQRFGIVVQANEAKFSQHAELKAFLLQTGKRVLVEASPVDRIWGIGMAQDDPQAENPRLWRGFSAGLCTDESKRPIE